jgi:serine/threonine-protein kinase
MAEGEALLLGRYRREHLLGRGGMAEVYLGQDLHLGRPVAIKLLYPHLAADAASVRRFQHEARAVAALAHPNVVEVYDVGELYGRPALVMQYVPGESLAQTLDREGRLPAGRALALVRPVLAALAHAHARGIVHRDVKPANVLLTPDGQVKLADFGIAQTLDTTTLTGTGQVLGSIRYLAPERLMGARGTPAADCYAVGVMLYRMLAGRYPFDADTPAGIAAQQLHTIPRRPSALHPDLPAWLDILVLRALAKEPAARYVSAASMLAALDVGEGGTRPATAAGAAGVSPDTPTRRFEGNWGHPRPAGADPAAAVTAPFAPPPAGPRRTWAFLIGPLRLVVVGALALAVLYGGSQVAARRPGAAAPASAPADPLAAAATSFATPAAPPPTDTPVPKTAPTSPPPSPAPRAVGGESAAGPPPTATSAPRMPLPATPQRPPAVATPPQSSLAGPGARQQVRELRALVQQALRDRRLGREGRELDSELEKLEERIRDGKPGQAQEQLGEVVETLGKLAEKGQVDPTLARAVGDRLAAVARSVPRTRNDD